MALSTISKVCLVVVLCLSFMSTYHHEADAQFGDLDIGAMLELLPRLDNDTIALVASRLAAYVWNNYHPEALTYINALKPYITMAMEGNSSTLTDLLERLPAILENNKTIDLVQTLVKEMRKVDFKQLNSTSFLSSVISIVETIDLGNIWSKVTPFFNLGSAISRPESVDETCYNDTLNAINGLLSGESWALSMAGSFGWPGPGLLRSKVYLAGSSSQCVSVQATSNATGEIEDVFAGKYCRASLGVPGALMQMMSLPTDASLNITIGMCVPDSCESTDIEDLLPTDLIGRLGIPIHGVMCLGDIGGIHDDEVQGEEFIDGLLKRMLPLMNDPRLRQVTGVLSKVMAEVDLTALDTSSPLAIITEILQRGTTFWGIVRPYIDPSAFLAKPDTVGGACYRDVIRTANGMLDLERWTLEMLDAVGKPGPGILQGRMHFLGSHAQCLAVESSNKTEGMTRFGGQYCRVETGIPPLLFGYLGVNPSGHELNTALGVCVPNTCNSEEIKAFLPTGFLEQIQAPIKDVFCLEKPDFSQDVPAIVAVCLMGLLILVGAMGSLYDMCVKRRRKAVIDSYDSTSYDNHVDVEIVKGFPSFKLAQQQLEDVKDDYKQDGAVRKSIDEGSEKERTKLGSILDGCWRSFSVMANIARTMDGSHAPDSITCLSGIRVLTIAWVVLCNTYYFAFRSLKGYQIVSNLLVGTDMSEEFTTLAIANGSYAADTFFLVSGCVICYVFLRALAKCNGKLKCSQFIYYYLHRFFRLTPAYMTILMVFVCLYRYLGDGPLWPETIDDAESCRSNWWTHLLYVNNFVSLDDQCLPWTWFMGVLMQLYVITPIFILFLYFIPILGLIVTFLLAGAGVVASVVLEMRGAGNLIIPSEDPEIDYMKDIYIKPWCRVTPYAAGILLGFLFYRAKKLRIPKCVSAFCWPVAIVCLVFVVYISYTETREGASLWGNGIRAAYEGGSRVVWSLGVAWVIFACHYGAGGYVDSVLSWKAFVPLSRLVYGVFLGHPILMCQYYYTRGDVIYVTHYTMVYLFIGNLVLSFGAAFLIRVGIEAPFQQLEKTLMRRKDNDQSDDEGDDVDDDIGGYELENPSYEEDKVRYVDVKVTSSRL